MTVMGIIGCRVFEDEIVHVLSNDPEVERIYLVKNKENIGLLNKLRTQGFEPVVLPIYEIRDCLEQRNNEFSVIVQLQEIGLHIDPARLKNQTYTNLNQMVGIADGILLFYGVCGRAFSRVKEDFPHTNSLQLLEDRSTGESSLPLVDCIAVALGGNSRYLETLKRYSDAFFLTPMWAVNWRSAFRGDDKCGFEFTPESLRKLGYRKIVRVNTGLSYEPDFEKKIEEFASNFGFEVIELEGSTETAQKSYNAMQNILLRPLKS
ncbi:MAG: DUF1638 domain-containing protein [Euryarchaeota archaeon]|nr:DUF1638 domain-containing protein [Euryarchaeota archaeon]